MGLVAPRYVGSSQTRARTRVSCIGRQILNHCTTREALIFPFWIQLICYEVDWADLESRSQILTFLFLSLLDWVQDLEVCKGWRNFGFFFLALRPLSVKLWVPKDELSPTWDHQSLHFRSGKVECALLSKEMWTLNLAVTVIWEKLSFPCSRVCVQQSGTCGELIFSRITGGVFKVLSPLSLWEFFFSPGLKLASLCMWPSNQFFCLLLVFPKPFQQPCLNSLCAPPGKPCPSL